MDNILPDHSCRESLEFFKMIELRYILLDFLYQKVIMIAHFSSFQEISKLLRNRK
jgi:hypothetical protein